MILCKHCGEEEKIVKNGIVRKKQRYLCKSCNKTFREGDTREKYTLKQKIRVMKLYTDGMGIRAIGRSEGISGALVISWIRQFGQIIRKQLCSTKIPEDEKEIDILEVDELFTYYQKKAKKHMCGLLWTETGIKLLI